MAWRVVYGSGIGGAGHVAMWGRVHAGPVEQSDHACRAEGATVGMHRPVLLGTLCAAPLCGKAEKGGVHARVGRQLCLKVAVHGTEAPR
jgi:hypothetical protein